MGMCVTSEKLGFDTAHRPGALTRYFAERWLKKPRVWFKRASAKDEQLIAWLLEAALGRNSMYFIEKTKEYVDAWGGNGEIVPENAFDGFTITGDPVEDTLIPHAILVWTCMNDRPWPEEVYHDWLDKLLAAGSKEAAYLAASLWPAHDLMAKVTYRPARWLIYRGQLDAEAERLILMEMLMKGECGIRSSFLYGSFEYDNVLFTNIFQAQYIESYGFTHPICGLVGPIASDFNLKKHIQEALDASNWSEGVKGAAMLLYLSLKPFNNLTGPALALLHTLEQNLFKLDERHIDIINFHMDKIEKIDYNLIKDYINYLIILYSKIVNKSDLSMKMLSKYMSIGLKSKDIIYIGEDFKNIIFNLMLKEKDKVESWLENQADDLRIKDILLAIYITKRIDYIDSQNTNIDKELKNEHLEKKIEYIYGKIKCADKISLFVDQARKYFNPCSDSYKIYNFIENILKREAKINFNCIFREDYAKIINSYHPNRHVFSKKDMFLKLNHIGLYLYYSILQEWKWMSLDFTHYIKLKELEVYSRTRKKIINNLFRHTIDDIEMKLDLYLNKIENNNFPCEEIKFKLITELIDITENNNEIHYKISEYLKDERKIIKFRELILPVVELSWSKFRNSSLIGLLGINNKSQNIMMY